MGLRENSTKLQQIYDAVEALDDSEYTPTFQEVTVSPTESAQVITADSGYDALSKVTVTAIQTETKTATPSTSAQDITPSSGKYLTKVSVGAIQTETKTATPTASAQDITPTSGKYLTKVTVNATPTETKSISANGTYTPTSGKFFSSVSVDVPAPTYDTPSIDVSTGGLITASANGKSGTKQLTTQATKTVTPTKSEQTAVASGVYTTGAVKVGAIPSEYIVPSGSETKTENGTYDVSSLAQLVVNVATGGGLPSGISKFDFGTYTKSSATTTAQFEVTHKLGVVPDFVMFYTPTNIATTYSMLMAIRGSIVNWRSGYNSFYFYHGNSTSTVTITNNNNANYGIVNAMTASSFKVQSHSTSYYWRAGTYNYIAIKFG